MTIHVNIGEAKTRLSELVAASLRGEEVILQRAGVPTARIVPVDGARQTALDERAARRRAAFGKYRHRMGNVDLPIALFQNLYPDYESKFDDLIDRAD